MSEAAIATSVPVPIAMPRSAWASAGASLMPSPTIATTLPSACSAVTLAAFCSGSTSASTCVDADLARDRLGRRPVVAGQHPDVEPERLELRDRLARLRLERVGDGDHAGQLRRRPPRTAASRPRRPASRAAPLDSSSSAIAHSRHQRAVAERRRAWPSTVAWMPLPVIDSKPSTGGSSSPSSRARATIASPSGCSEPTSAAAASRSSVALGEAVRRDHAGHGRLAAGERAGLVEHDRVDLARLLQRLAAPDQDAVLGRLAGADHDRGRRRQAERAGAGDDQHRDRDLQRVASARVRPEARASRRRSAAARTSTAGTK